MIIKYLSDLHLEFKSELIDDYFDIADGADVVVIAGDLNNSVGVYKDLERLAMAIFPTPLIYVTGNHDYYHGDKLKVNKKLTYLDSLYTNFHFLNRKSIVIDNILFIGATGWQNFQGYGIEKFSGMNDFHLINKHEYNVLNYGQYDYQFIEDELVRNDARLQTVVVTHLSPTERAINFGTKEVDHKGSYIRAYYNDYDNLIETYEPDFWICGHCHDSFFDIIHHTIICRNALGYKGHDRENLDFVKNSILTIS